MVSIRIFAPNECKAGFLGCPRLEFSVRKIPPHREGCSDGHANQRNADVDGEVSDAADQEDNSDDKLPIFFHVAPLFF